MSNYAFGRQPLPDVENGHTFRGDNFTQLLPNTAIFEGKTGLTFINCLLVNCVPPVDSTYDGARPYNLSFCTHVNPRLVDKGLAECETVCEHVVDTDTVTIDGEVVDTIYHYEHKVVAS